MKIKTKNISIPEIEFIIPNGITSLGKANNLKIKTEPKMIKEIETVYDLLTLKKEFPDVELCSYEGSPLLYNVNNEYTLNKKLLSALKEIYPRKIIKYDGNIVSHHNNRVWTIADTCNVEYIEDLKVVFQKVKELVKDKRFKSLSEIITLIESNIPYIHITIDKGFERLNYWSSGSEYMTMVVYNKNYKVQEDPFICYSMFEIPYRYKENVLNKNKLYNWCDYIYNGLFENKGEINGI